jgi:hypothetical protein
MCAAMLLLALLCVAMSLMVATGLKTPYLVGPAVETLAEGRLTFLAGM